MYFFFFGQGPISEDEFNRLKDERMKLQREVEALLTSLQMTEARFKFLSSVYEPRINLIEVNNKSMGHRYIGKFSVPHFDGRTTRYTISIGRVEEFKGKTDERLMEVAKEKVIEHLKKKHPDIFLEKI